MFLWSRSFISSFPPCSFLLASCRLRPLLGLLSSQLIVATGDDGQPIASLPSSYDLVPIHYS